MSEDRLLVSEDKEVSVLVLGYGSEVRVDVVFDGGKYEYVFRGDCKFVERRKKEEFDINSGRRE